MKKYRIYAFLLALTMLALCTCSCRKIGESKVPEESTEVKAEINEPETEAETEAEPEVDTDADGIINIVMVGDVLIHERVRDSGKMADGTLNYDHLFANLYDEISGADISIVNQEVILGGKELGLTGYPSFNGAHEMGDALVKAGFDVVLHATNHALDKGKNGLLSCLSFWDTKYPDINVVGISNSAERSREICVIEDEGIKVAILNYTYGMNGIALPSDMPWCVNMLTKDNETNIREDIKRAQSMADYVIVAPHWGTEYIHTTDASQQYWKNVFFECGVDLVLGTHPHVVEGVDTVSDGNHSMLVYYSIGNYVNSTASNGAGVADRMLGAMADITLEKTESGVVIKDYGVLPIVSHVDTTAPGMLTVYRLDEYTEALAAKNEIIKQDSSFSVEYMVKICREVFGELYEG